MGSIKLLDKETINKIAAGEVVERPASVVKELVENSIDSGATMITCEIKDGGKSFIRITDNGCGFDTEDIKVAFLRHATSKITCAEDLEYIRSLGFRGEALSSISAVAKVELLTKKKEDFLGNRYVIEGGQEKELTEAGCPDGTTFIIRDLFYNTPARLKFLKSSVTEAGYVGDLINRLAVSHPEIAFRFINQGKTILFTNGNGNEKDALYSIYGREVASNLIKVSFDSEMLKVEGYVGKPVLLRGNRICENYYINGRFSKSQVITKAIEEAYKGYSMQHKYPFTSLHFTFPIEKLDINVHPTKMEVKISDSDFYYAKIFELVNQALRSSNMIVDATLTSNLKEKNNIELQKKEALTTVPQSFEANRSKEFFNKPNEVIIAPVNKSTTNIEEVKTSNPIDEINENRKEAIKEAITPKTVIPEVKEVKTPEIFINYLRDENDNIVTEAQIDNYTSKTEAHTLATQNLNETTTFNNETPTLMDLINAGSFTESSEKTDASAENKAEYKQLSFDVKDEFMKDTGASKFKIIGQLFNTYWLVEMDENLFIIDQHAAHEKILYERTIKRYREQNIASQRLYPPIIVTLSLSEEDILNRFMEHFNRLGFELEHFGGKEYAIVSVPTDLFSFTGDAFFHDMLDSLMNSPLKGDMDVVVDKIASMSCKAAIKGNMSFTTVEAESLIKELLKLENPYHCPHGRPIIISLTKYEIEKKFKRII